MATVKVVEVVVMVVGGGGGERGVRCEGRVKGDQRSWPMTRALIN